MIIDQHANAIVHTYTSLTSFLSIDQPQTNPICPENYQIAIVSIMLLCSYASYVEYSASFMSLHPRIRVSAQKAVPVPYDESY